VDYPDQRLLVLLLNQALLKVLLISPSKVKTLDLASVPTQEVLAVVNHPREVVVISQEASQEAKGEELILLQEVVVIAVDEEEAVRPLLTQASTALKSQGKNDNKIIESFTFSKKALMPSSARSPFKIYD
jgi:hypothetical protein